MSFSRCTLKITCLSNLYGFPLELAFLIKNVCFLENLLFSCNTRFEIGPFALLATTSEINKSIQMSNEPSYFQSGI